jgi:hypothetical protein
MPQMYNQPMSYSMYEPNMNGGDLMSPPMMPPQMDPYGMQGVPNANSFRLHQPVVRRALFSSPINNALGIV